MARCGCTPKCNCAFEGGVCTKIGLSVTGGGGCDDPTVTYAVNILTDNATIVCGDNGLETNLTTVDTNTVDLEGDGSAGDPLEAHVIRTPDANVPGELGQGNLIKERPVTFPGPDTGIYVSCEDVQDCVGAAIDIMTTDCLNYDDVNNTISIAICGEPNGIECIPVGDAACPTGGLAVFPSSDANNTLDFGTDDRLYVPATAILPGECMTFTGTGTAGDPFVITPLIAPEQNGIECVPGTGLLVTPSADANNSLVFGGDTRLFINRCPLTVGASQVLTGNAGPCFEFIGGDCNVPMQATLRLSDDVCQGLFCGNDGLYVEVDQTPLPGIVQNVRNVGPFGPFNGTNNNPLPGGSQGVIVDGPQCIQITNPSPCRPMQVFATLDGTADIGRTAGELRVRFEVDIIGGGAGPWFQISQVGTGAPNPAGRFSGNAAWDSDEPGIIGPGATATVCTRLTFRTINANAARIFNIQSTLTLVGRWSE